MNAPTAWGIDDPPAAWRAAVPRRAGDDGPAALLWQLGALGVWERPDVVVGWFATSPEGLPSGAIVEREEPRDWQEEFKRGLRPVQAGRFRVVPSWWVAEPDGAATSPASRPTGADVIDVVLDPGESFGSGHHATTVMCLELLGELALDARRVLDVGSGTGVLAVAAALAGASQVHAVDLDPAAVAVTRRNASANGVTLHRVVQGSTDAAAAEAPFDVVVANLLTDTVAALSSQLAALVAPGGTLVVSGITRERASGPLRALQAAGLRLRHQRGRDGWVAAVLRR